MYHKSETDNFLPAMVVCFNNRYNTRHKDNCLYPCLSASICGEYPYVHIFLLRVKQSNKISSVKQQWELRHQWDTLAVFWFK